MWPRVDGMRTLELGTPGAMREELTALVVAGVKTATAGTLEEYQLETEGLEYVGERLAVLGNDGRVAATVAVTAVETVPFAEVSWEFAQAEGEGFTSVEHWRSAHRRYWQRTGTPVDDDSPVVLVSFRLVDGAGDDAPPQR
ncbi:ASCH domain-containing protein [Streptomyces purpureus]|uniref:ASCH domain-containing protein n=1 Tax=Streptomyces purpureus TaxID=1951 RepID=UPI0037BADAFF